VGGEAYSEAETARYIFAQMGLDPTRLILEPRSRNTYENILNTKALVKPKPGEVWLLATSAIHMPRALGVARKLNWPMLPWPTDYLTGPHRASADFNIAGNLGAVDYAVHEWVGGLAYRLAGKSAGGQ
ncbi:MAG TPA: YdcF family protein, partial [Rhizomicrobium sp.]|nr:YdcF family protein [Rhizomicrobium sp.]